MEEEASIAAAEAELVVVDVDPETALLQKQRRRREVEVKDGNAAATGGFEWEVYKENVRPLKRGRNVKLLNDALRSQADRHLQASLLGTRRHSSLPILPLHPTFSLGLFL
ncbi:hypothetical protein BHE74_00032552 [Ensete ventricosum]|nr:hypothetical protein BHE74_00032552 [Ensete ventricosum]